MVWPSKGMRTAPNVHNTWDGTEVSMAGPGVAFATMLQCPY